MSLDSLAQLSPSNIELDDALFFQANVSKMYIETALGEDQHWRGPQSSVTSINVDQIFRTDEEDFRSYSNRDIVHPAVQARVKPFKLEWVYGISPNPGLISLANKNINELFFAAGHEGVIYNHQTKEITALEGHQGRIKSFSADQSGQFIVTADGNTKETSIIVWNSVKCCTIFTIFNPYSDMGTQLLSMAPSARHFISVGVNNDDNCLIDYWLWTFGNSEPNGQLMVSREKSGLPIKVSINPNNEDMIMVVFERLVVFLNWDSEKRELVQLSEYALEDTQKTGFTTNGTYLADCHQCYVSTGHGYILCFGNTLYCKAFELYDQLNNAKRFINIVKVSSTPITTMSTTLGILCIGNSAGQIMFFDSCIRLLYWFNEFNLQAIRGIAFPPESGEYYKMKTKEQGARKTDLVRETVILSQNYEVVDKKKCPKDATLQGHRFPLRNFAVTTSTGNIHLIDVVQNTCTPLFPLLTAFVTVLEYHRRLPYLVIGYSDGKVSLVHTEKNILISSVALPPTENGGICAMQYSRAAYHLIVARDNGELWILDPISLATNEKQFFHIGKSRIKKIVFAYNCSQFAYYDKECKVYLFNFDDASYSWIFKGKIRSHSKKINDICFSRHFHFSILCTIGEDRHLVEYNNLQKNEEFKILNRERIDQKAIPKCFTPYVPPKANIDDRYVLIADDERKFKSMPLATKVFRSIALGPAYGCFKDEQIKRLYIVEFDRRMFLFFKCQKYMGLQILPPDGNPFKYVGYLAHPVRLLNFTFSNDRRYLYSCGRGDSCIYKWRIKYRALEKLEILGGKELDPYYCLMQGGRNGWIFNEMIDMFYYMQILEQGESLGVPRHVVDTLPITELPDLARACGFYPTEFEIGNMLVDIKYRDYDDQKIIKENITFVEFVKLFINHRPPYGYSLSEVKKVFDAVARYASKANKQLKRPGNQEYSIDCKEFIRNLASEGEDMEEENLEQCFKVLMRFKGSGGGHTELPEKITFDIFVKDVLGIIMERDRIETDDIETKSSSASFNET